MFHKHLIRTFEHEFDGSVGLKIKRMEVEVKERRDTSQPTAHFGWSDTVGNRDETKTKPYAYLPASVRDTQYHHSYGKSVMGYDTAWAS